MLGAELELIGYRVDALPTASQPLQLTLWWWGVRPAAADWTAFFHLTPLGNDLELLGQMDQALTAHAYPPPVWSPGEVVVDYVQIRAVNWQRAAMQFGRVCNRRLLRCALPSHWRWLWFLGIAPGCWILSWCLDYEQRRWHAGDDGSR